MTPSDPIDAITAALVTLRGRRMPRGPWQGGPPWAGMQFRPGPAGGLHADHHDHHDPDFRSGRPDPRSWGPGAAPWAAHGRFGGPARLRLLEALAAASGSLSVSELGEAIGVDQPRASRLVQQSVEMGLVRREADPDDARRTRIALTEQGSGIVRGFRGDRREAIEAAVSGFSADEVAELARLLTKLASAWPRD